MLILNKWKSFLWLVLQLHSLTVTNNLVRWITAKYFHTTIYLSAFEQHFIKIFFLVFKASCSHTVCVFKILKFLKTNGDASVWCAMYETKRQFLFCELKKKNYYCDKYINVLYYVTPHCSTSEIIQLVTWTIFRSFRETTGLFGNFMKIGCHFFLKHLWITAAFNK